MRVRMESGFRLCWRRGFDDEAFDVVGAAARASTRGEQALFGVCAGPVAEAGEECVVGFALGLSFTQ